MSETSGRVFDPRIVAALIAAGVAAFGLFLVLAAYAGDFSTGRDGRGHALSGSAVGFKGLVRLIDLGGGEARMIRTEDELDTEDLLVVAVEPQTRPEALDELLRQRGAKATLVVLPKWRVVPDPTHPGWVRRLGPLPDLLFREMLGSDRGLTVKQADGPARPAQGEGLLAGFSARLPAGVQTVSGKALTPMLRAAPDRAVLARLGEAPHYLLADPDLLNNHALKDPARARAALALLAELNTTGARSVAFDLTLNGFAHQPNPLKLAFEPPFLPLTIALVLAAILGGLHGAFRFGPAAEEPRAIAFGKTALVENSAGLLRIARREHRAASGYAELVREAAARDSGAHLALRDAELDAYFDRLSPPDRPRFTELVANARAAGDRTGLVAAARALFQWKKDLIK